MESFANCPVLAGHETATESGTGDHNLNMLHMRMELLKSTRLKIYCCKFKVYLEEYIPSEKLRNFKFYLILILKFILILSLITNDSH